MAQLYDGKWRDTAPAAEEIGADGQFRRQDSQFRSVISPAPGGEFPAEAGRYRLWVAAVCPWAGRTTAFQVLKGLQHIITIEWAEPGLPKEGWTFPHDQFGNAVDGGFPLHWLYTAHDPQITSKVTVPTLWDDRTGRIVNNESADIIRMFNSAFNDLTGDRQDFYPEPLRPEIDRWNEAIYPHSTTAFTAQASRPASTPMTWPWRACSPCWTRWRRTWPPIDTSRANG